MQCTSMLCHFGTLICNETSEQRTLWDQYKFKWFVPCIEVKRFLSHYMIGEIKFGDLVLSIVERFNKVSLSQRVHTV